MEQDQERNIEEINEVLNLAKLTENDILPTSQVVYFTTENLHDNNFKLLQLTPELHNEINEGQTLYIKGKDDDDVVICSETRTFHVTEAETSNSLLLVKDMKFSSDIKDIETRSVHRVEVSGTFYEYLEAVIGKPHLYRLHELLSYSVYKGPECEYEINKEKLYSLDDLNNMVQASSKELKKELESMDVVTIDGKIRLLDFEYHFRILSYMLKLIEENSWKLDEIDYEETVNSLKDLVPSEVLNSLFDKYAEESEMVDGLQLYRYNERKICQFFAQILLHEAGKFNLNEFLQAWRESVPEGMVPNEEMLYGVAIIDRKSTPNVIWAFEETNLPDNIVDRFKLLFETKEKWTVPEITPYIRRLATEKVDVNALLAKHARASKLDGIKYYSAKHAK